MTDSLLSGAPAVIGFLILVGWGMEYGGTAAAVIALALLFDLFVARGIWAAKRLELCKNSRILHRG